MKGFIMTNKKSFLDRLQKYESFIAWTALLAGLLLLAGFILAYIIKSQAELDAFVLKTSSTQWHNDSYSGMYFPENKLVYAKSPTGESIVEKCVLYSGVNLTADSSGTSVLVDDEDKKIDEAVFITDIGERVSATSSSDGVDFTYEQQPINEFTLDGYYFEVSEGKVRINGLRLASYGEVRNTQTTTTVATTTPAITTTPPETTTTDTTTTAPVTSENEITATTPPVTTTKKPVVTTTVTTKKPVTTTTTKKPATTTTTTTKKPVTTTTTVVTAYKTDDEFVKEVLKLVNAERKKAGLNELKGMISLDKAATIRAQEITGADENFSHTRPDGNKWYTVLAEVGISPMVAGENLAAGQISPEMVVSDWMASEDHKANILDPEYDYVGIGYVKYNGYYYWAQIFAAF